MNKRTELNKVVKESITQALLSLMRTKSFSDITITDIILRAGVARASYYRNFKSREEIVRTYVRDLIASLYCNEKNKEVTYNDLLHFFKHIANHKSELKSLFDSGVSGLFLQSLNEYFLDIDEGSRAHKWLVYAKTGAMFNVINMWLAEDMRQKPEELAQAFFEGLESLENK